MLRRLGSVLATTRIAQLLKFWVRSTTERLVARLPVKYRAQNQPNTTTRCVNNAFSAASVKGQY